MNDNDIRVFESNVKRILDWSNIDPGAKDVLQKLMAEVTSLAEKLSAK